MRPHHPEVFATLPVNLHTDPEACTVETEVIVAPPPEMFAATPVFLFSVKRRFRFVSCFLLHQLSAAGAKCLMRKDVKKEMMSSPSSRLSCEVSLFLQRRRGVDLTCRNSLRSIGSKSQWSLF